MKGLLETGEDGLSRDESGDVGAALARLNFGVEDLNRQLKLEVRFGTRYDDVGPEVSADMPTV